MVKVFNQNLILIVILVIALFLRTYRLDYLELFGDELDAGYQSYSLLMTGADYKGNFLPTYVHSFSEWRAPGLMYFMIPFIKIFGLNEWGVRMGPAIFGVLSILAFYLLLIQIKVDKKIVLLSVFFLTISPWHIQYSRAGFEITLLSCLLIFGLYFLIKKIYFISALLLSLSLYTYSTANILMPLLVIMTIYFYKISYKNFIKFIICGIFFSIPIIYQVFFGHVSDRFGLLGIPNNKDVIAEVNDYRNGVNQSFTSKIFYNKYIISAKRILFNYSNAFSSNFLFNEGDVTFRHSLHQVGNLFWVELPLIIIGLIFVVKQKKLFWVIGFLLVSPIASSLTIDGYNHATRLFLLVFPLSFLAAFGFYKISKLKYILFFILLFEFSRFQYYYWYFYRDQSWKWWHTGYKQSMQYIANNSYKYQKVLMDNTYEPALIRFLFWNKVDSRLLANFGYNQDIDVDGFKGYCLQGKYCFVNFADKFKSDNLKNNTLYLVSQERSPGLDKGGLEILKTVTNYYSQPIFYLISKSEK